MMKPRIVWITGASSGIGAALAARFARMKDTVIATARSGEKLLALQKSLNDDGILCETAVCDVRDETSVANTAQNILDHYGAVDILINNAGVTYFKTFAETSTEEFDHVITTNLRGMFLVTKAVLPTMSTRKKGLIFNILSYTTKALYTKSSAYAASKAAAEAMMNVLRAETRREGIRIVNVYPGAVLTPIWHPRQQEKFGDQMLKPEYVADILYTLSVQPEELMVEEIVLRPQGGDLQV